ncbi:hypothetical protein N7509_003353 [Penicillium cosmopolitanum]|uniref:Uncharacterized protein n=1 Tax=Penicillium cosmopolitanum TaxID=1131564 RepID=A0A9X0BBE2_9EURO|nr:uncharacterized protein N7509_003353 [Penicillium cosmopolitanum]KAJ5403482.1 hypothetical protein N7509_003353 [Penicillium cosmopolitanum]
MVQLATIFPKVPHTALLVLGKTVGIEESVGSYQADSCFGLCGSSSPPSYKELLERGLKAQRSLEGLVPT